MLSESEKILYLEDMYCLRSNRHTPVTVRISKWHYHIWRVALTFIEDYHRTSREIDKAIREGIPEPKDLFPEDYPKHFEMICRPNDLRRLAKAMTEICEPEQ